MDNKTAIRDKLRIELGKISEFCYSDGCVLFDTSLCTPAESANLDDCGILDTISRLLSDSLDDVMVDTKQ